MKRSKNQAFALGRAAITALALLVPGTMLVPVASAADITKSPPAKFKNVSTLVKLPDFIPGMGTLYVDPSTLPVKAVPRLQPQRKPGEHHLHGADEGSGGA